MDQVLSGPSVGQTRVNSPQLSKGVSDEEGFG